MPTPVHPPGAARLLAGDIGIGFLLLNEVRHRVVGRVFGVSRKDSNVVSAMAIGLLAGAVASGGAKLRSHRMRPSGAEAALGAAAVRETAHTIAGEWSRATPFFAATVVLVMLEKSFGPALRASLRAAREVFRGVLGSMRRTRALLGGR